MNKTGGRRKMFITIGQMRQVDLACAQHLLSHLLSPLSVPFFKVKFFMTMVSGLNQIIFLERKVC
jgi:hypothetical protein